MESALKRAQTQGERITVEDGRKAVTVLSWGDFPLGQYLDKQNRSYVVPNNFRCFTKEAKQELVGETRVSEPMGRAQFRFCLFRDQSIAGDWKDNPTAALDNIHAKIKNKRHRVGANGLLVIGFKYPPLQQRIKEKFSNVWLDPKKVCSSSSSICHHPPTMAHSHTRSSASFKRVAMDEGCGISVHRKRQRFAGDNFDLDLDLLYMDQADISLDLSANDEDWFDSFLLSQTSLIIDGLEHELQLPQRITSTSTISSMPLSSYMSDDEPSSDIGSVERDCDEDFDDIPRKKQALEETTSNTSETEPPCDETILFDGGEAWFSFLSAMETEQHDV